jgi:hypothetical protein
VSTATHTTAFHPVEWPSCGDQEQGPCTKGPSEFDPRHETRKGCGSRKTPLWYIPSPAGDILSSGLRGYDRLASCVSPGLPRYPRVWESGIARHRCAGRVPRCTFITPCYCARIPHPVSVCTPCRSVSVCLHSKGGSYRRLRRRRGHTARNPRRRQSTCAPSAPAATHPPPLMRLCSVASAVVC